MMQAYPRQIIMLKFHNNDTTIIATFEDFILTTYVIIDDLYQCFAPPEVKKCRHVLDAKLSDSEIIAIALCGELVGIDEEWYAQLFEWLENSKFRSSFHLKESDKEYIRQKGMDTIREHARDFIAKREALAVILNDGKQTPMKGYPVFIAQHATATCCRQCIQKWHKMRPGRELNHIQQEYLVDGCNHDLDSKGNG